MQKKILISLMLVYFLQLSNSLVNFYLFKFGELTNTKSLLCIPVTNSSDQVVALIFACNKIKTSSLSYFSKSDINIAEVKQEKINLKKILINYLKAFALFCGIGIQNIMMYEKVVRAMNMQQVALDVLSYHVSSNQEEVDRLIVRIISLIKQSNLYYLIFKRKKRFRKRQIWGYIHLALTKIPSMTWAH